eukprot:2443422-Rhodomonas_salina.1
MTVGTSTPGSAAWKPRDTTSVPDTAQQVRDEPESEPGSLAPSDHSGTSRRLQASEEGRERREGRAGTGGTGRKVKARTDGNGSDASDGKVKAREGGSGWHGE